jgi:hypothetical protein
VQVARVRGEIVEAVGREPRIAEAPQVRHDHLEAGVGERADVAPPDPLGLGPSVHQQQRVAADALAYVGELDAIAHLGALGRERVGSRRGHASSGPYPAPAQHALRCGCARSA